MWRDETGATVTLGKYFVQKPVILVLSYLQCPRLCPLVLEGLLKSLRPLSLNVGEAFHVVTVSIDPRETSTLAATIKANYVQRYGRPGAASGWHVLTGNQEEIDRLAEAVGFRYTYDAKQDQFAHASGIVLVTPKGQVARYLYGIEYAPRDVRLGLVEAAANTIGSPIDQLLLFCYHYDPQTGQYSAAVMNIMRLAGGATVLMLGTVMGVLLRRERKTRRRDRTSG
jgi:protein SCO1/2